MNLLRRIAMPAAAALALAVGPAPAAYASPGGLDPSFGSGGLVLEPRPGCEIERIVDVAPEPSGGAFTALVDLDCATQPHAELTRYLADGSRDPAFGTAGRLVVNEWWYRYAEQLVRLVDGSLVAVVVDGGSVLLQKFTPAGALDPAFGRFTSTSIGSGTLHLLDTEPLAAGGFAAVLWTGDGTTWLAHFTAAGSLDTGFDGDGLRSLSTGPRPDGAELRGGAAVVATRSGTTVTVARYDAAGAAVVSGGVRTLPSTGPVQLAVGADWSAYVGITVAGPGSGLDHAAVYRLRPDGSADPAYGLLGTAAWADPQGEDQLADLLVDAADHVVLVTERPNADGIRVARLEAGTGRPDSTFGSGGRAGVAYGDNAYGPQLRELAGGELLVAAGLCCPGWSWDTGFAKLQS